MLISPPQKAANEAASVLIVEDEGIIASHIAACLGRTGFHVAGIAESSEEALAKIEALNPELVLMDIRIKGDLDGIETAAKVREQFDIPVIFLTAHTDQQTIARARVTGACGFLTKPIHYTSLATSIEMAVYKHRAARGERHQRAWMATVLGTMADAIAVVDSDGKIQFLNQRAEELTGWKKEDARELDVSMVLPLTHRSSGRRASEVLSPPSTPRPPHEMPRGLLAGTRSGKRFPIEGEIAPSADGGKVAGAVISFRDATARQARESEIRHEHKMQAVGRLAAGIAHDFNNILFIILGYTEDIICKSGVGNPSLRALNEIAKAARNATSLTQQLLKFSRKEPVEMMDVNLNDVIRDTEEIFRRLGGPSIRWQFSLDEDLGVVRADLGRLKQVLMNLAANARDAISDAGSITIETANVDASIALSVMDTGSGMSPETAEHLFEPFFTTKGLGKGTGLGLSIVHSIVTDLGGTIRVDSAPGEGATFTVLFPRPESTAGMPAPASAGRAAIGGRTTNGATVLLVEDHESVRCLLRTYLVNSGCRVLEAENGEQALRVADEHDGSIDLLITDVMMPRMGGFEMARELSDRRGGIKIIFISGYAEEFVSALPAMPSGARFLPKPFVKDALMDNVRDLLGQKKNMIMKSCA